MQRASACGQHATHRSEHESGNQEGIQAASKSATSLGEQVLCAQAHNVPARHTCHSHGRRQRNSCKPMRWKASSLESWSRGASTHAVVPSPPCLDASCQLMIWPHHIQSEGLAAEGVSALHSTKGAEHMTAGVLIETDQSDTRETCMHEQPSMLCLSTWPEAHAVRRHLCFGSRIRTM